VAAVRLTPVVADAAPIGRVTVSAPSILKMFEVLAAQ
jgi:hypothetical protein